MGGKADASNLLIHIPQMGDRAAHSALHSFRFLSAFYTSALPRFILECTADRTHKAEKPTDTSLWLASQIVSQYPIGAEIAMSGSKGSTPDKNQRVALG